MLQLGTKICNSLTAILPVPTPLPSTPPPQHPYSVSLPSRPPPHQHRPRHYPHSMSSTLLSVRTGHCMKHIDKIPGGCGRKRGSESRGRGRTSSLAARDPMLVQDTRLGNA
eukprot:1383491-Rhodomonas_salina.2